MFDLTRKLDSLEKKLDSGFQRIERKLDDFEKRLVGKFDHLDISINAFEQSFARNVFSLRSKIGLGFTSNSKLDALAEQVARLELDVARLKANAQT
jgi:hypothetical protein